MAGSNGKLPPSPLFTVRLRPIPGVDHPIIALRGALKVLLRRFGFRAVGVVVEHIPEKDGET